MAKNMYADFKKKLDRIENHIAEEVAPQANELLKESVRYSLIDWYNDYTPQSYERTYNFMKILDSTKTRGKGNILHFSVDSSAMDSYAGWFGQTLQSSTAFDYMIQKRLSWKKLTDNLCMSALLLFEWHCRFRMKSAFLNILSYGALHNIKSLSYKLTSLSYSYIGGYIVKKMV